MAGAIILIECLLMPKSVLPNLFSTATQLLERQSVATHIALLDKKVVLKKLFIIEYNFTKKNRYISHNEEYLIGALFFRLLLMTAYIMCLIFYPFLILFCFFTFPFLMILNFCILKRSTFQKLFATHQKSARDPPVWETLV
jgi:hypothetical protein